MLMFGGRPSQDGMSSSSSMLAPSMGGDDKNNFDSTQMDYGSGNPTRSFGAVPTSPGNTGVAGNSVDVNASRQQPNQTDGTLLGTSGGMGSTDWLRNYSQDGKKLSDSSVNYWNGKWNEWGSKDPAYYQKFLSNAEEFTGGSHQTAMNMWGFDPTQQSGGGQMQGGDNGMSQLMPMLMQLLQQSGQKTTPQQAVSNGSLFQNAPQQQMDISSFLR